MLGRQEQKWVDDEIVPCVALKTPNWPLVMSVWERIYSSEKQQENEIWQPEEQQWWDTQMQPGRVCAQRSDPSVPQPWAPAQRTDPREPARSLHSTSSCHCTTCNSISLRDPSRDRQAPALPRN